VGNDLKVLNTRVPSIPFSNGVYRLGSNVSVCAIPPAIQSRITASAEGFRTGLVHPSSKPATGAPAANAASVAALDLFRNSRLFQVAFILTGFDESIAVVSLLSISSSIP
jgi:hypothetical protein